MQKVVLEIIENHQVERVDDGESWTVFLVRGGFCLEFGEVL